jgi:protein-L-isoaspartate(D-aspartate) O-methyltransferase
MQSGPMPEREAFALARRRLVARLRERGLRDTRALWAMREVPRHLFLPDALHGQAYRDTPLPIGEGQTISAPGVVATMTEALALTGPERVLEVGTGSGYQAAVLSLLAEEVVSVERIPGLAEKARRALASLGVRNVTVHVGDGTRGRADDGVFERILVTAGGPDTPLPLLSQLAIGGLLVGPFGPRGAQDLLRMQRTGESRFTREVLGRCRFVDLIGEHGWAA